jgi:predicted metal-dependent HD superfamily phosphohydrolase
MIGLEMVKEVEDYVRSIFKDQTNDKLFYHTIEHAHRVVAHTNEIALFYKLDEESLFVVLTAAWFHDIGYLFGGSKDHEFRSVFMMNQFISNKNISRNITDKIETGIMATKRFAIPLTFAGEIICDADTYHFGTSEFRRTDLLVKKEMEQVTGWIPPDWINRTIEMLRNHKYYTSYCREKLDEGKNQNIAWLQALP